MHRIDTSTAQINKFGPGKNGFTNGEPSTGRRATDLNSDMWDAVQEELCSVIENSGIVLNKNQHDQLYQAIVEMIAKEVPDALLRKNNLSDLVNKAVARKNLELGTAATCNVQTSQIDNASSVVLLAGAGGLLGGGALMNPSNDADLIKLLRKTGSQYARVNDGTSSAPLYGAGFYSKVADTHTFIATNHNTGITTVISAIDSELDSPSPIAHVNKLFGTANPPTASETNAVPTSGGSVGYLDGATYYDTKPDVVPRGSGAWDAQLNSGAPFYAPNWVCPVKSGGYYVPLVKGVSTRAGEGYPTAVSFGYILPSDTTWASPVIHAKGDGSDCSWQFNINTGGIWSSKAGGMSSQTDAQNRANDARDQAKAWAYQNLVADVRLSGIQEYIDIPYPGQAYPPAGSCITAIDGTTKGTGSGISFHISRIYFQRIQKVISGNAYNIA